MNVIQFIGLDLSVVSVAVSAAAVAAAHLAVIKFREKLPDFIAQYLPLATAFIAAAVRALFSGAPIFSEDALYFGVLAYSVGTIVALFIGKILRGEKADKALVALLRDVTVTLCGENVDGIISEIVAIIANVTEKEDPEAENVARSLIFTALKKAARQDASETQITAVAELILQSAKQFKKERK